MANMKYFHGDRQLVAVTSMPNAEFAKRFPGVVGRRYDGYHMWVGSPVDARDQVLPVERVIEYKSNPSRHECDARCLNATGRIMRCECSCGGENHGRGSRH
ncbi:TPA: hypothetical protein QDA93_006684 [Burkholderia vietnamiensis]|nr:hypothetical protein [Burkholderia vietnamiensis]